MNASAFCWQLRKLRDLKSFRSACAVVPKTIITEINKYSINSLSLVVHNTFSLTSLFNRNEPFYDMLTVHWFDIEGTVFSLHY